MNRWRNIKHQRNNLNKNAPTKIKENLHVRIFSRIKAFIIDTFMIYIPILYITTYLILDGKNDFLNNQIAIFLCTLLFGILVSLFLSFQGQTPGFRAYEIMLIDLKTKKPPSFLRAFFRFFCFLFACASVIGILIIFFRKDGRGLHDILSSTSVINIQTNKSMPI